MRPLSLIALISLICVPWSWATTEPIILGQPLSGTLDPSDEALESGQWADTYTCDVVEGQELVIHLHSDEFDGEIAVTDTAQGEHFNDDFGSLRDSQVTLTAPADGAMQIQVRSHFPGDGGSYVISVASNSGESGLRGTSPDLAQVIGMGQTITGYLQPGDQRLTSGEWMDVYSFYAEAGTAMTLSMRSDNVDTYLILISPSGQQTDNDDSAAGQTTNSEISMTLSETGEHWIAATTYAMGETGAYEISLSPTLSDHPTGLTQRAIGGASIGIGDSAQGTLAPGDSQLTSGEWMDTYTLQGNAGDAVSINMSSASLDSYLILIHPDGQQDENDDATLGTRDSRIVVQLPQTGTYQVVATTYAVGETGDYTLSVTSGVQSVAPSGQVTLVPIAPDEMQSGTLAQGDAQLNSGEFIDRFTFEGEAGQQIVIAMESSAIDPYLILWFPSGDQEDNDDAIPGQTTNSRIEMTLPESGTYVVGCTSYAVGESGPYTLSMATGSGVTQPTPTTTGREYYGLFCGISDYAPIGNGGPDLPLCRADALKLAEAFTEMGFMEEENCIALVDADATRENIETAFADLAGRIDDDDVFIFFYSGHGGKNRPNPMNSEADQCDETIVPHDGQDITDDQMARLFDGIDAEIAMICLDSCFSGGFARDVIVRPHRMGFFSSEEDLTSAVASKFQAGGYLSHFFLQAVQAGEADNDPNDGILTVGELCHYLQVQFARNVIESVTASGMQSEHGYQHLVVDRGGVKLDDVLLIAPRV